MDKLLLTSITLSIFLLIVGFVLRFALVGPPQFSFPSRNTALTASVHHHGVTFLGRVTMQWEKPSPNLNPVAAFSFAISARAALC
jgi:hypothetical protein